MEKISLYRLGETMPWAELEATQSGLKITIYERSKENCEKAVLMLRPREAAELVKVMDILLDNYSDYDRRK